MPGVSPIKAIGSVFPDAGEEAVDPVDSLWRRWTEGFAHAAAFQTARGALRALLEQRAVRRLWLPAYICHATHQGAPPGCEVLFYDHGPGLALADFRPATGDAVLGVDYFGRVDSAMAERARREPGVLWIEDRAQALDPGAPPWGAVVLYSPRKLIGVADGGLLVSPSSLPQPSVSAAFDETMWAAHRLRSLDPDGRSTTGWSGAFQAREAAFDARPVAMHPRTRTLLELVAAEPLAARRQANARTLQALLPDFALWPTELLDFVPLAFPIRVWNAGEAVRALAAERIFSARHWTHLPSPAERFPGVHRLSRQLVSLPCDQRYDAADMERVASTVRRLCRPAAGSR